MCGKRLKQIIEVYVDDLRCLVAFHAAVNELVKMIFLVFTGITLKKISPNSKYISLHNLFILFLWPL